VVLISINLNDLEPQSRGFSVFAIFGSDAQIKNELQRNGWR